VLKEIFLVTAGSAGFSPCQNDPGSHELPHLSLSGELP